MTPRLITPISHLCSDSQVFKTIQSLSFSLEARERSLHLIGTTKPTHFHIDFDLNHELTSDQLAYLDSVSKYSSVKVFTFQISRDCIDVALKDGVFVPLSQPLPIQEQIQNVRKSVDLIQNILGQDRLIGVENNNFHATGAYDICTSSDFIREILRIPNLFFLLDYPHAIVTACNAGIDLDFYVDSLMYSNKCVQMHLCQPTYTLVSGTFSAQDSHELPSFELTQRAIAICRYYGIPSLTVEFYKNSERLIDYLIYLNHLIGS